MLEGDKRKTFVCMELKRERRAKLTIHPVQRLMYKPASTTMDTFKEILCGISYTCETMKINEDMSVVRVIISNIQSFMSHRAKVNISIIELLQQYKSEILPKVEKEILSPEIMLICSQVNKSFGHFIFVIILQSAHFFNQSCTSNSASNTVENS